MLSCKEATRLVSEAQERKLFRRERLALGFHKLICSSCRRFEKQMDIVREAAHRFARGEHEHKH